MADEPINISVTDDGSLAEIISLLETLGLTGSQALERLQSGFQNTSQSLDTLNAQQRLFGAGVQAGLSDTTNLSRAIDALSTSEAQAAGTTGNLTNLINALRASEGQAAQGSAVLAESFANVGSAGTSGAAAVNNFRASVASGSAAFTTAGSAAGGAGGNFRQMGLYAIGAIQGLTALAGGITSIASASKLISASDDYANLINGLKAAGVATGQLSQETSTLTNISKESGVSLDVLGTAFDKIKAGDPSATVDQVNKTISNLTAILRNNGATAEQTTQFIERFSTQLGQAGVTTRTLTADLGLAPQAVEAVGTALGTNVEAFTRYNLTLQQNQNALTSATAAADKFAGTGPPEVGLAATKTRVQMDSLSDSIAVQTAKYQQVLLAGQKAGSNSALYTAQLNQQKGAILDNTTRLEILNQELAHGGSVTSQQAAALEAQRAALVDLDKTFSTSNIVNSLGSQTIAFQKIYTVVGDAVTGFKSAFEQFVGESGAIQFAISGLVGTIDFFADHMRLTITLIGALGLAVAAVSFAAFIASLVIITNIIGPVITSLRTLAATSFPALVAAGAPVLLFFAGFAAGVAVAVTAYVLFEKYVLGNNNALADLKTTLGQATDAVSALAQKGLAAVDSYTQQSFAVDANTKKLNDLRVAQSVLATSTTPAVIASNAQATQSYFAAAKGIQQEVDALAELKAAQNGATQQGSGFSSGAASGGDSSGYYGTNSIPTSRNGSSFRVAGGGGVDSVPIMVSPGEVVTIQTNMQHASGVVPTNMPKFANGGVFAPGTGFGVSLGLSGVSSTLQSSTGAGSVTGFSATAIQQQATAAITATTDNTTAVNDNTDAVNIANQAVAAAQSAPAAAPAAAQTGGFIYTGGSGSSTSSSSTSTSSSSSSGTSQASTNKSNQTAAEQARLTALQAVKPQANGTYDYNGAGYSASQWDAIISSLQGDIKAAGRNGGDLFIRARNGYDGLGVGGGGVDSNLVNLAMSPGESLHVRTASQRRDAANNNGGGNAVFNLNIQTNDAGSFNKSADQVRTNMYRTAIRANRKVRGA